MKRAILLTSWVVAGVGLLSAQSASDLFTLSESQLRGTARYMSMAGAFGALGGDISTLTQNPAGIGVYRSSDISATLDIDPQRITLGGTGSRVYTDKSTRVSCNNFGYVGAVNLNNSVMPYFQWGATYNRVHSYDRYYRGYFPNINTSWTNYIAYMSQGYPEGALFGDSEYDPFFDANSDVDWLSILAYNTMLINPSPLPDATDGDYVGLFQGNSTGNAEVTVRERGYIDEYSINFGGNFSDMIYWGIGFGIRDLNYIRTANYNEQISNAWVPVGQENPEDTQSPIVYGNGMAEWGIDTYQRVSGTGFNLKLGLIFKPINEFRLGFAVHTPTWYNLDFEQHADVNYGLGAVIENDGYYTFDNSPGADDNPYASTGDGYFTSSMKTPWRLMASAAGVIGGRFILSADYVYEAFADMAETGPDASADVAKDVKQYYQGAHELRLGAELRVTPQFSIRAGYGYKSTASKSAAANGGEYIYTSGVNTMYMFEGDRQNVTFGLGYRFGQFYADLAYVHSTRTSQWYAFSPFPRQNASEYALMPDASDASPRAQLTDTHNRIALTVGFRF